VLRLPDAARRYLVLTTLAAVALCVMATAGAQTTRRTRATAQSKPTPSPTPIVVPRRPAQNATTQPRATPTPARVLVVPSQNDETPPPSNYQRPTPTPTPAVEEPENEADVVRVTSNLVVVPVAVTDAAGNAVQGLKKEDFRLEEEGRGQELATVGTADEVPLDIAVLFDISSSVTAKNFFTLQQEAAARFLRQVLKPTDRAAIITIADKPVLVQPLATADTATAKILTIPAATTSTPTAFYDSISFAAKYLDENAPGNHRRVILAISDGDDNFSNSVREQTVAEYEAERKSQEAENGGRPLGERAAARRDLQARHQRAVAGVQRSVQGADAVFYSINPGGPSVRLNEISTRAQNGMQTVADATGGTAYVPARTEELETIFRQIAAELRAQYLLQYLSNNQATAGKFLRIKVTTPARPDLRIRARQGYYKKG
jgi:Ca-activated chloride channel family protein